MFSLKKVYIFVFFEILFLVMLFLFSSYINNPLDLIVFFGNIVFVQIFNYMIAKQSDEYLMKQHPNIYQQYYEKSYETYWYPQFIAVRLTFNGSKHAKEIENMKREVLLFLIVSSISVLVSFFMIIFLRIT